MLFNLYPGLDRDMKGVKTRFVTLLELDLTVISDTLTRTR